MATMSPIERPKKGSRISSFYPVKTVPPISSLDSAFQLQEYISLLIRHDVHDVDTIVSLPGKPNHKVEGSDESNDSDKENEKEGKNVDENCWIYEQLRRIAQDLSHPLITMLQLECTRETCPQMKAVEWMYLCVAHGDGVAMESCCAIDYTLHTLDSATALLNSPRAFPSRLSIPLASHRHFSSLPRRLSRIFAHAYFHHREAFEQAEAESSLYARFLALVAKFNLVNPDLLVIPSPFRTIFGGETEEEARRNAAGEVRGYEADDSQEERQWGVGSSSSVVGLSDETQSVRGISPPIPEKTRGESPRRIGRSRTDTMVHSDAASVVEELSKVDHNINSAEELDKAIAEERALGASDQSEPAIPPPSTEPEATPAPEEEEPSSEPTAEDTNKPSDTVLEIVAPAPTEPHIPLDVEEEGEDEDEAEADEKEQIVPVEDVTPSNEEDVPVIRIDAPPAETAEDDIEEEPRSIDVTPKLELETPAEADVTDVENASVLDEPVPEVEKESEPEEAATETPADDEAHVPEVVESIQEVVKEPSEQTVNESPSEHESDSAPATAEP
ncbi:hypothetical protein ABKN59_002244 [Abortiporus biennis]